MSDELKPCPAHGTAPDPCCEGCGHPCDEREEIARIIDPEGYWERLDSCNHALATVSMTDDQRRALTAVRDDELRGTASSLAKADAILARAQGPGPVSPCYECGTDNLIGPICGGCNPEIAAMVDGGPGPGEAVVKAAQAVCDALTQDAVGRWILDAEDPELLATSLLEALAATHTREG